MAIDTPAPRGPAPSSGPPTAEIRAVLGAPPARSRKPKRPRSAAERFFRVMGWAFVVVLGTIATLIALVLVAPMAFGGAVMGCGGG